MIQKPIQLMPDFRPGGFRPQKISFSKFQSIFERAGKFGGFDWLSIRFDSDNKLLSARAGRDAEGPYPDLAFSFSRSQSVFNRIIKIFRARTLGIRVSLPIRLLDSYSLVPKKSKLKGIRIRHFSDWVDGTVDEIEPLLRDRFGLYYLSAVTLSSSDDEDNALLWKLSLRHEIHDDTNDQIEIKTPVAKKWITMILPILDAKVTPGSCTIKLSCLESFSISKGGMPKSPEPSSDDDISF
jgi:hypothetical protein